jgi:hypothetical protein
MERNRILYFLKLSCFLIFAGRAYQHLFWDAPFRSILWDQQLLEPLVNKVLNMNWSIYVTDLNIDENIQKMIKINGLFYLLCAVISLKISFTSKKIVKFILLLGGINLFVLALLLTKNKFYHIAMFFEHAIQFGTPIILYFFLKNNYESWLLRILKVIISLSFACHGLYAIGLIYPIPETFVTMTINILPINDASAKYFLFVMGILDFLIAISIFVPKTSKICLIYAFVWGIVTALARIISGFNYGISFDILHQYFYLTVYRIPHGIIPLLAFLIIKEQKKIT